MTASWTIISIGTGPSSIRQKWLRRLTEGLPSGGGGRVLDLGCGASLPVARELVALGHSVLGVDASAQQIARARRNVPEATFIKADMFDVELPAGRFDGSARSIRSPMFPRQSRARCSRTLRDGSSPAAFSSRALERVTRETGWESGWEQRCSSAKTARKPAFSTLRDAGLTVQQSESEQQDNEDATFLWITAVKPTTV